jgi:hypothetical protein
MATLGVGVAAAQVPQPRHSVRLDTTSGVSFLGASIVTGDDFSGALFTQDHPINDSLTNLVLRRSDGRAVSFDAPLVLPAGTHSKLTQGDSLRRSGDTLYAAWWDYRNTFPNTEVYFSRSSDLGSTWLTPNVAIDKGFPIGSGQLQSWRFAISPDPAGDHLYFLFQTAPDTSSPDEIYLTASHDGGNSFGSDRKASSRPASSVSARWGGLPVRITWSSPPSW